MHDAKHDHPPFHDSEESDRAELAGEYAARESGLYKYGVERGLEKANPSLSSICQHIAVLMAESQYQWAGISRGALEAITKHYKQQAPELEWFIKRTIDIGKRKLQQFADWAEEDHSASMEFIEVGTEASSCKKYPEGGVIPVIVDGERQKVTITERHEEEKGVRYLAENEAGEEFEFIDPWRKPYPWEQRKAAAI
jgi:hypothetical protein